MTPAAIIALVKDAVILIAAGLAIYLFVSYGKDIVKVADMKALEKQLISNTQIQDAWRKEQTDANTKRDADLAKVADTIAGQRDPVYVMRSGPSHSCSVPAAPAKADSPPTGTGGVDAGSGSDSRPAINRYELKVETVVADCRAVMDQWPQK
jgi:hypothetical protein